MKLTFELDKHRVLMLAVADYIRVHGVRFKGYTTISGIKCKILKNMGYEMCSDSFPRYACFACEAATNVANDEGFESICEYCPLGLNCTEAHSDWDILNHSILKLNMFNTERIMLKAYNAALRIAEKKVVRR